jgi:hypothetical protein
MKLKLILATAVLGTALAVPTASTAQLPPTQDSVSLTGAPAFAGDSFRPLWRIDVLNATSGPSGENPTGQAAVELRGPGPFIVGPVTCLAVRGNTATMNVANQVELFPLGQIFTIQVVDDQPDTFVSIGPPPLRAPADCSPLAPEFTDPLLNGDITVVDAQPLPTSKDQCRKGGWRDFPQFKNQGQCIAFLERGPGPQEANAAG